MSVQLKSALAMLVELFSILQMVAVNIPQKPPLSPLLSHLLHNSFNPHEPPWEVVITIANV